MTHSLDDALVEAMKRELERQHVPFAPFPEVPNAPGTVCIYNSPAVDLEGLARAALKAAGVAELREENERLKADRAAILELIDGSADRWSPIGGDPEYIDGYEVGAADACGFLADDIRRGPPYPSAALTNQGKAQG